jgi:hypothetical protein
MPILATYKECQNPCVVIAVLGAVKKAEKPFPVVVKVFPTSWENN